MRQIYSFEEAVPGKVYKLFYKGRFQYLSIFVEKNNGIYYFIHKDFISDYCSTLSIGGWDDFLLEDIYHEETDEVEYPYTCFEVG